MTQQCTKRASSEKITDFSILEHIKNTFFYCGLERDVNNLSWKFHNSLLSESPLHYQLISKFKKIMFSMTPFVAS